MTDNWQQLEKSELGDVALSGSNWCAGGVGAKHADSECVCTLGSTAGSVTRKGREEGWIWGPSLCSLRCSPPGSGCDLAIRTSNLSSVISVGQVLHFERRGLLLTLSYWEL